MKNYWRIKGCSYWEQEVSQDERGIWVNIGWHTPLHASGEYEFQKIVAMSAFIYSQKFN